MRASLLTLSVVLFAVTASASPAHAAAIVNGPYLQHLGPDRVEVRVELGSPSPVVIEYGGPDKLSSSVASPEAKAFHTIALGGLVPATRYQYRVRAGGATSETGDFVTAPRADADAPFVFAIYGDNRTDTAAHEAIVRGLRIEGFDFLVNSGDFVQQGGEPRFWHDFFAVETPLLRDKCMFGCIGNHELYSDSAAAGYGRYFGPSTEGALYGTFRWGKTRFFLLNAFHDWAGGDQRAWLERELTSADAEPGLRWRFAVIHHSPWSGGPHGANKRLLAAGIPALLVKHHVDLVIAGHDHIYERGEAEGLKYLISGGGGAPLYQDVHAEPSTRKIEASYHYVLASVTPDAVNLHAKRVDGSTLERSSFRHGSWETASAIAPESPLASAAPAAPGGGAASPARAARSSSCGCRAAGVPSGQEPLALLVALGAALAGVRSRNTSRVRRQRSQRSRKQHLR